MCGQLRQRLLVQRPGLCARASTSCSLQRKATCAALGWDTSVCSGKQINGQMHLIDTVDDRVDGLLVGLGRVLRYGSLLTTEHIPVITDLRAPDAREPHRLRTMHKFGFTSGRPSASSDGRWAIWRPTNRRRSCSPRVRSPCVIRCGWRAMARDGRARLISSSRRSAWRVWTMSRIWREVCLGRRAERREHLVACSPRCVAFLIIASSHHKCR